MADFPVQKTDDQWKQQLTSEQYRIAREKGTERAFTGEYWDEKRDGQYVCVCCGEPLYKAETKFDSGTGWPSFYDAVDADSVATETDRSHGMTRVEIQCARCDCHLGHVFSDGPEPTRQRHCVNSESLVFVADADLRDLADPAA
jgi:peptide-methionine (R)-S-oxide reductase